MAAQRQYQRRDPHGWLLPDFAKLQTGGFIGLVTAGIGYGVFDDVINVEDQLTPPVTR